MAKKGGASWLATFADLMSLLMALFVLLFSMANVDITKYKAVVESFNETLGNGDELTPEQVSFFQTAQIDDLPVNDIDLTSKTNAVEQQAQQILRERMEKLKERLERSFQIGRSDNPIGISYNAMTNQIKMVFPEQIAFETGSADLKLRFNQLLKRFYEFKNEKVAIQVVGHTDNRPIYSERFRSNWELSSARAASVIHQLIEDGSVRPNQVQAIGLADTQPIYQGSDAEGLAKNRRVEILITPEVMNGQKAESQP